MTKNQWDEELRHVEQVFEVWEAHSVERNSAVVGDPADDIRLQYRPLDYKTFRVGTAAFRKQNDKESPYQMPGYLAASPVDLGEPKLYPMVSFVMRVRQSKLDLAVRMVTYFVDGDVVDGHGWRFECADNPVDGERDGFHAYPHVQRISAWSKNGPGLFPEVWGNGPLPEYERLAAHQITVNESKPAFPLPCKTPAGVIVAAMASIYGGRAVVDMVRNSAGMSKDLVNEIKSILRIDDNRLG